MAERKGVMELDVKAGVPSASGWQTSPVKGMTYVTNWRTSILLYDDIWEAIGNEDAAYYRTYPQGETGWRMYMTQDIDSGYSNFWVDNPENHDGIGGREIKLEMHDGSTTTLVGPWSSNSGAVNQAIRDVIWKDDPQFDYVQEATFYSNDWRSVGMASAIALRPLNLLVKEFLGQQWHLAWGQLGGNPYIELHPPEPDRCKGERIL